EGFERYANARCKISPPSRKLPNLEGRGSELVRQEAESGDQCRPTPVGRLEVHELNFERVARLRTLDIDGAVDLIYPREIESLYSLHGGIRPNLSAGGIQAIKLDGGT